MHPMLGTADEKSLERVGIVSPDVFTQIGGSSGRVRCALSARAETEAAANATMHLYLQGLLSQLPGKNAEETSRRSSMCESPGIQGLHRHSALGLASLW
jgi:hypothetical protein